MLNNKVNTVGYCVETELFLKYKVTSVKNSNAILHVNIMQNISVTKTTLVCNRL